LNRLVYHRLTGWAVFGVLAACGAASVIWDDRRGGDIAEALILVGLMAYGGLGTLVVGSRSPIVGISYAVLLGYALLNLGLTLAGDPLPHTLLVAVLVLCVCAFAWAIVSVVRARPWADRY
jgi:hypothetical protein